MLFSGSVRWMQGGHCVYFVFFSIMNGFIKVLLNSEFWEFWKIKFFKWFYFVILWLLNP